MRPVIAAYCIAALLLPPGRAVAQEGDSSPPPAESWTLIPVEDGTILYVRYGEGGGVRLLRGFSSPDSVPEPAGTASQVGRSDLVESMEARALAELVRRILREELQAREPLRTGRPADRRGLSPTWLAPQAARSAETRGEEPAGPGRAATGEARRRPGETAPPRTVVAVPETLLVSEQVLDAATLALHRIPFETGSDALIPPSEEMLRAIGSALRDYPEVRIRVEGHADPRGRRDSNLELSLRRAERVRTYLLDRFDFPPERVDAVGYGEAYPWVEGNTPTRLALNRRVEVRILNPETLRRAVELDRPR